MVKIDVGPTTMTPLMHNRFDDRSHAGCVKTKDLDQPDDVAQSEKKGNLAAGAPACLFDEDCGSRAKHEAYSFPLGYTARTAFFRSRSRRINESRRSSLLTTMTIIQPRIEVAVDLITLRTVVLRCSRAARRGFSLKIPQLCRWEKSKNWAYGYCA